MLLAWGRYEPPATLEHAQAMVHLLVVAHQTAGVLVIGSIKLSPCLVIRLYRRSFMVTHI